MIRGLISETGPSLGVKNHMSIIQIMFSYLYRYILLQVRKSRVKYVAIFCAKTFLYVRNFLPKLGSIPWCIIPV